MIRRDQLSRSLSRVKRTRYARFEFFRSWRHWRVYSITSTGRARRSRRNLYPERLCGLQVDDQLELGRKPARVIVEDVDLRQYAWRAKRTRFRDIGLANPGHREFDLVWLPLVGRKPL